MSGGGGDTTVQENKVSPYEPSEPYLNNILTEASNLYQSGTGSQYYPGSTVVPFAQQTQQGLQGLQNLSTNQLSGSPMMQQAANVFSGYAAGQAPNIFSGMAQLSPQQAYLGNLQSSIANQSLNAVQDQFGGMGRTGTSPGAQAAAQTAFTQAYAPIATQLSETERNRQLGIQQDALSRQQVANQFGQQQQLMAAQALPGMQSAADARALAGAQGLAGVGGAFEDLQGRMLQEDLQRYQYEQMSPYNRLAQYAGIVSPIASGFPITQQAAEQPRYNALTGALGGGLTGASAAQMLGSTNPYFALGGALLGGMGGFF
tara:strand:- start:4551 stop:5498 length:948 start_codon:yes stop_codon:yes gene_type:complete